MDLVDQFIKENWPLASVIFRPMMSCATPTQRGIMIGAINNQVTLYRYGPDSWKFYAPINKQITCCFGKHPLEYLLETDVGKEMTALEEDVDEYITAADYTPAYPIVALLSDLPNFRVCFDITHTRGTTIRMCSREGAYKWSTLKDVIDARTELLAAEKLIARRRAYLAAQRLISELPQPIAEEVEEQFEPFEV